MAPSLSELEHLLPDDSIVFSGSALSRKDAVRHAGSLLVAAGAVDADYVDEMLDREAAVSTYVGSGIAMPHGTLAAKSDVLVEGLSLILLDQPVDWGGESVTIVIGIAAHGRRYIALLSQLATVLLESGRADQLRAARTPAEARKLLAS